MRVVEAVRTGAEPTALPADAWYGEPATQGPRRVVKGIDAVVDAGADALALFSELGVPWARSREVSAS